MPMWKKKRTAGHVFDCDTTRGALRSVAQPGHEATQLLSHKGHFTFSALLDKARPYSTDWESAQQNTASPGTTLIGDGGVTEVGLGGFGASNGKALSKG